MISLLLSATAFSISGPGTCEWVPPGGDDPDPPCDGVYNCTGCGVQCSCAGGGESLCRTFAHGQCDKGPGPTCTTKPGKCDVCAGPWPHETEYGCSECLADSDCAVHKTKGHYPQFCYEKTGLCDGECGGGGGSSFCKSKYENKPFCIDYGGTGGWCYECDAVNDFEHTKSCDPGKGTTHHSDKPFCLGRGVMECVSCHDLYAKFKKCPADGEQYGLTCVHDEKNDKCFSFEDAPCTAFDGFCPTTTHGRPGGDCDIKQEKGKLKCVDKK